MAKQDTTLRGIAEGTAPAPPVAQWLGLKLVSVGPGEATMTLVASMATHGNGLGVVQGGVLCALADAAMGVALATTLEHADTAATINLHMDFLRPARDGILSARARAVHIGRTVGFVECDVVDEGGQEIARATCSCRVRRAHADE
jgi:uncharacterized protein (TIGR00369 family)